MVRQTTSRAKFSQFAKNSGSSTACAVLEIAYYPGGNGATNHVASCQPPTNANGRQAGVEVKHLSDSIGGLAATARACRLAVLTRSSSSAIQKGRT
jgi:hypothetical protein